MSHACLVEGDHTLEKREHSNKFNTKSTLPTIKLTSLVQSNCYAKNLLQVIHINYLSEICLQLFVSE